MTTATKAPDMPASRLHAYMVQSGTPDHPCALAKAWCDANPKGSAHDLFEHLRERGVYDSTLTKIGKWLFNNPAYSAKIVLAANADEEIVSLRKQIAQKDDTIKELSARCGALEARLQLTEDQRNDLAKRAQIHRTMMEPLPEMPVQSVTAPVVVERT
jgi:hypothetical protein